MVSITWSRELPTRKNASSLPSSILRPLLPLWLLLTSSYHPFKSTILLSSFPVSILLYLEEQYDPEFKFSPPLSDKAARAAYLSWLVFAEASLSTTVVYAVMHTLVLPEEVRNAKAAER
jgi:hypothetical protein